MINLCNRTEYSFKLAYGQLDKVIEQQGSIAGICDRHGTWGHVSWQKVCKEKGIKPVFGVELAVVDDAKLDEKQGSQFLRFLALSNEGLKNLYDLATRATSQFYYFPRIDLSDIKDLKEIAILTSWEIPELMDSVYLDLNPTTQRKAIEWAVSNGIKPIATSDNYFPSVNHRIAYEVCIGRFSDDKATAMHILNEWEMKSDIKADQDYIEEAIQNAKELAERASAELPYASLPHIKPDKSLREMCIEGAKRLGVNLNDKVYAERLERELSLIEEKKYADYFYIIADLCKWAKKRMLVGPARGSSCGSLVCYLTDITSIDPIPYDLLFERFIDVNREDLPDIDIDFPDTHREQIFTYLKEKYGETSVAQLGTVNRFKAKSTISNCAKELKIPMYEVKDLKDAIIERSSGDSRAAFCIMDTFNELEVGKKVLSKYPEMRISEEIEAHASHSGRHAAGIVVTSEPVNHYCSVDVRTGATQVDKIDAEFLNLLKIDALGLRTLSVIQDCLDQIGWTPDKLLKHRLDDQLAFSVLNDGKFTGIFQYEGYALQSLCHQLKIDSFEDVVSITALARPGPLNSGMATEWLRRKNGEKEVVYDHPMLEPILHTSFGVVIYQENIMQIAREIGKMSWGDVSSLRKAMSKSLGKEFFDKYKVKFLAGAAENGFEGEQAEEFWDKINTFGSWAFNRSHAVAYGMLSYWCMVLKSHFPLEYAAACLRHAKDDRQIIMFLRELDADGYEFRAFDKEKSKENWSVEDGVLIGGLTGIKGIGEKIAADIVKRRKEGRNLTGKQLRLIEEGQTPYDMLYECRERFGHILDNPREHNINSPITELKEITQQSHGEFVFIAKLTEKNLRDHNELVNLQKRGGRIMQGQSLFLNFTVEDDTDSIICTIDRFRYEKWGKPIIEGGKIGDWYIFKGRNRRGFRKIYVDRWKKLT